MLRRTKVAIPIALLLFMGYGLCHAQRLMGLVVMKNEKGIEEPIPGANVHWAGTGVGTSTRENGVFLIDRRESSNLLVISFAGLVTDTLVIDKQTNLKVELRQQPTLQEVTVEGWKPSTSPDYRSGINMAVMSQKELFKAACCNLSESFETNPSVDVAFTDAVTGTRQIQMLGLSGPNTMISIENMPGVRGLASYQGIQFIPGTWIRSIQVTKGVGSVVNGYESIAGQINVELQKPQESERVYANSYVNSSGRTEANLIYTAQTGKKWGTTFLVHGSVRPLEMDQNKDGFLDFPKGNQISAMNRWIFHSGTGWLAQFSVKYIHDIKQGGQTGYQAGRDKFTTNRYGFEMSTDRYEFTGKVGYQFQDKPYKSFGLQVSGIAHDQDSYFGFRTYDGSERAVYLNWIYQSIIVNTFHKFKTGLSYQYDQYKENLAGASPKALNFNRTEQVPGVFAEYAYDNQQKFSAIVGMRIDQHNLFGTFYTPRAHFRYALTPTTAIRASAGRGIRVANIIAENPGFLASSRSIVLSGSQTNKAYGFRPDKAWNYGLNANQDFDLAGRPGTLSIDYFFTDFQNQAVVDYDKSPSQMNFYGLTGRSYSSTLQTQLDYQVMRRFDIRLAYRWTDVETDYQKGRLWRPLVPRSRAFVNLAYATRTQWKFDATIQRIGQQRLPETASNPVGYQLSPFSPDYFLINGQATKELKRWSIYAGVENAGNFRLKNPIVSAQDPFGPYFDSSMVWGPVFGRMWYAGFRYKLQ